MPTNPMTSKQDVEMAISDAIKNQFKDAADFRFYKVGDQITEGNTYYIEYKTKELNKNDSYYYAFVNTEGCKLLANGEEAIVHMQTLLEKRRSFLQRLRDFDFLDLVGALIALPIVTAFVFIVVTTKGNPDAISKEFLTIVSLILGYYFGRNKIK